MKALASHQCGLHSNFGPRVIRRSSLLLVRILAEGFSPVSLVFFPLQNQHSKFQFDLDACAHALLRDLPCYVG